MHHPASQLLSSVVYKRVAIASVCFAFGGLVYGDQPAGVQAISAAYAEATKRIQNLRVDYQVVTEPLVDMATLYKLYQMYELPSSELSVVVTKEGQVYHRLFTQLHLMADIRKWITQQKSQVVSSQSAILSLAEVKAALAHVKTEPTETVRIFDGTRLLFQSPDKLTRRSLSQTVYQYIYIPRLTSPYFSETPLDYCLCTLPCPGLPRDNDMRRKHRVPDLFARKTLTVSSDAEQVGTHKCIKLADPQHEQIWLAFDLNFAVVKREFYYEGVKLMDVECGDHREVLSGVWLANKVIVTHHGAKGTVPASYEGKPLYRSVFSARKSVVNSSDNLSVFQTEPPAGDLVLDETLVKDDRKGKIEVKNGKNKRPTISYTVPADRADLERVIKDTEKQQHVDKHWGSLTFLLCTNLALVVLGIVIILVRRSVAKTG